MLETWTHNTSCNGVIDLYESRKSKPHFLFWTCTMVVMVVASVFFTVKTVLGFVSTPTITNYVTMNFENLTMPNMALCYNGGMNGSALKSANLSDELIYILSKDVARANESQKAKSEFEYYLKTKNLSVIKFYKHFGFTCADMVEEKFQAGDPNVNVGCKGVAHVAAPIHGVCLVYKNNGYQYWPGMSGGMKIKLKSPSNSVLDFMPQLVQTTERSNSYLLNVEHNLYFLNDKSVLIPMNTNVEIVLKPVHHIRLPQGDPCSDDVSFVSTNVCFHRCFCDNFNKSCGCTPFRYYNEFEDGETKVCTPFEDYPCDAYDDKNSVACQKACAPMCDEWTYELSLSFSVLYNIVTRSHTNSTTYLKLGLEKMQNTQVEEVVAFTYDMAIANVGGQIGLWLGCSVITIIQLMYYLWLCMCQKFSNDNQIVVINRKPGNNVQ